MKSKYHYMSEEDSQKLKKMMGTPYYDPFFKDAWKKDFGKNRKCPSYPTVVNVVLGRSNNQKGLMVIKQIAKDADLIKRELKDLIENADYLTSN
jgi:hypothetical protein